MHMLTMLHNNPADVIPNLKPILDKGVAVIVEEYGCGDVEWQKSINIEMQKLSKYLSKFHWICHLGLDKNWRRCLSNG